MQRNMWSEAEALAYAEPIAGWMHSQELAWLYQQAVRMRSIVEIGSWQGRSTAMLCAGCPGPVYAVDPFVGFGEQTQVDPWPIFLKNMSPFGNCVPIRCLSRYAAGWPDRQDPTLDPCPGDPRIPPVVDMIFIDGEHAYHDVRTDLRVWRSRVGRLLCGHDRGHPGVARALAECVPEGVAEGPVSLWYRSIEAG